MRLQKIIIADVSSSQCIVPALNLKIGQITWTHPKRQQFSEGLCCGFRLLSVCRVGKLCTKLHRLAIKTIRENLVGKDLLTVGVVDLHPAFSSLRYRK